MTLATQQLAALLPGVIATARAAGAQIMRIYERGFTVSTKADQSPLTEADLVSQQLITARLAELAPQIPLLGEESSPATLSERRRWPTLWLVDPLDGTREFVSRNGEFTVNIALIDAHEPVLGVLYAPASQQLYAAARGSGAFRVDTEDRHTPIRASARAAAPVRVLASRSHRGQSLNALLERLGPHELVGVGSALKFGWLAEGRADFYPRLSPTSEWDTAAGQAIAEQAGARVVDLLGRRLRYNAGDSLINPSFAAWADASRDWLALLQQP
ncbi:MAG TPA: 3'(2'),5'-bisphosphate nucleotidase CysQ [Steroidobacteraceae bacterium]|nr:3'(2'),5'-bisphosphate nucleotidase CysQ [Steroidobacteraceae bacterium]